MSPHPEPVQARAERLLRSCEHVAVMPRPALGLLGSDEECAVVRDLLAELLRVITALEAMTQERDRLHVFLADASPKTAKVRQELNAELQRIPTLERDLAALREEHTMYVDIFKRLLDMADVFRSGGEFDGAVPLGRSSIEDGFTWALAEVRRLRASRAQALRGAFEAGVSLGYEKGAAYVGVDIPKAFAAFLASKQ